MMELSKFTHMTEDAISLVS